MENSEIREVLQKNRKKSKTVTEIKKFYMKKDLELMLEYFEKIKKENPNMETSDMEAKFIDDQYDILVDFSKSANIRGKYFQYKAAKELLKDQNQIERICEELKENKDKYKDGIYNANNDNNYRVLIEDLKYALKHREIPQETLNFAENYKKASNKEKRKIESNLSREERKVLWSLINTTTNDEATNVRNLMEQLLPNFENEVKKDLITSMETMGRFFEQFNFIGRYKSLNSSKLKGLSLAEIEPPFCKDKYGKQEVELNQLFTKEILEQYSSEDLLVLNAFWQNRFAKETERINNAIFAVTELNVLESENKKEYTDKEMELIETKIDILKGISAIISKILNEKNHKKNRKGEYEALDVKEEVEKILKPFKAKYNGIIFSKTGEIDNDISKDYITYALLYNQLENAYKCKNSTMINILSMIYDDKSHTNWGCITNELGEFQDPRFILIGIDYEGMNMPVRLHIEKDLIEEFLECRGENIEFPIYEGDEDFTYNGKIIPTQILMPVSNRYKKQLNKCLETPNISENKKRFLYHLRYIKDHSKYPEHLRGREKRFIDIKTGKEIEQETNKKDDDGR